MAAGGGGAQTDVDPSASSRATAYWGIAFVLLLLVSAGMVTVPGGDDGVAFVREFYEAHRVVIVIAQVIGVAAAVVFLPFAWGLQRQRWMARGRLVFAGGVGVTAAAILAGLPPLGLCVVVRGAGSSTIASLATASDLVDVVLFLAIAVFAGAVAMAADTTWVRASSVVVALVTAVRAALVLTGSGALELVAPMAFIVLVLGLAIRSWWSSR